MKGLLIVAHGSRRISANEEIIDLAGKIKMILPSEFQIVGAAFLEMASPNIRDKIEQYIGTGVTEIVVFPFFLAAGKHVATDIPQIILSAQKAHPGIAIRVTPHLGASEWLADLIMLQAMETEREKKLKRFRYSDVEKNDSGLTDS